MSESLPLLESRRRGVASRFGQPEGYASRLRGGEYQRLGRELVEVSEKICRLRPIEEPAGSEQKKTAEAIRQEVAREIEQLLRTIFTGIRKTGHVDLEAVEMLVRSAMHRAGAAAVTELLRFPVPDERTIPCPCGRQARYREMRSKTVLTVVGKVEVSRPWYLCLHCHQGQFPGDAELDVVGTQFSPGVRRMQAPVGQEAAFDQGREQMNLLAGLEVTTKSVERVAEAIGADIARGEHQGGVGPRHPFRPRGKAEDKNVTYVTRCTGCTGTIGARILRVSHRRKPKSAQKSPKGLDKGAMFDL